MYRKLIPLVTLTAVMAGACASGSGSAAQQSGTATPTTSQAPSADGAAGQRGMRGQRAGMRDEALFAGITLSDAQRQQVDSIRANYRTQMEQMRQQSGGDRTAMRGQMRDMMQRQMADIRNVLTPDQQKQFDANVAQMQQQMQQRRGGSPRN